MRRKWRLLSLWLCVATSLSAAGIEIKQAIGEVIRREGRILTGSNSRVEIEFPFASARVGSFADFSFSSDYREMSLASGTLLISARDDVTIHSGAVTLSMSRGDLETSNVRGRHVKVIALDGKVRVDFAGKRTNLRYGQMIEIADGATKIPRATTIDLEKLIETSVLVNMGPLRNQWKLTYNADRQNPPPRSLVNTPPMIAASRATAAAASVRQIAAQQALQAQAIANQELLADRRAQRLAEQAAARAAVAQSAQQLEAKRQSEAAQAAARQQAELQRQRLERERIEQGNNSGSGNQGQGNQGQGNNNGNQGRNPDVPPGQQR